MFPRSTFHGQNSLMKHSVLLRERRTAFRNHGNALWRTQRHLSNLRTCAQVDLSKVLPVGGLYPQHGLHSCNFKILSAHCTHPDLNHRQSWRFLIKRPCRRSFAGSPLPPPVLFSPVPQLCPVLVQKMGKGLHPARTPSMGCVYCKVGSGGHACTGGGRCPNCVPGLNEAWHSCLCLTSGLCTQGSEGCMDAYPSDVTSLHLFMQQAICAQGVCSFPINTHFWWCLCQGIGHWHWLHGGESSVLDSESHSVSCILNNAGAVVHEPMLAHRGQSPKYNFQKYMNKGRMPPA